MDTVGKSIGCDERWPKSLFSFRLFAERFHPVAQLAVFLLVQRVFRFAVFYLEDVDDVVRTFQNHVNLGFGSCILASPRVALGRYAVEVHCLLDL